MKGWQICINWKDGTQSWVLLKDVKASNPIQLAEYSVAKGIDDEPAFVWWTKFTLRKRNNMVAKMKSSYKKKGFKFGICVPTSIKEAHQLDAQEGQSHWKTAIHKEIQAIWIAFKILDEGVSPPNVSKLIPYHMVFYVKMDLTRKARLVARGHKNEVAQNITYSSVISRESVHIGFLLAALNGLDILVADVSNVYLHAKPKEKVHVRVGPELFGPSYDGQTAVLVRALYGLKSSGEAWHSHLATGLKKMGFTSSIADLDVWMKPDNLPDGTECYAYIMVYVDDLLCISPNPATYIIQISHSLKLKPDRIKFPDRYLGNTIAKRHLDSTNEDYHAMGSETYIREAIKVIRVNTTCLRLNVPGRGEQPFSNVVYRPELDATNFCSHEQLAFYQQVLGILRWIIELGRIDILYETSVLSQYLANPREGHLLQALRVIHYLEKHLSSWIMFDPMKFKIDWSSNGMASPEVRAKALKLQYPDAQEQIPINIPEPRGKSVQVNCFVDADHAGNKVTR